MHVHGQSSPGRVALYVAALGLLLLGGTVWLGAASGRGHDITVAGPVDQAPATVTTGATPPQPPNASPGVTTRTTPPPESDPTGFPDESTTGVPAGAELRPSGRISVTRSGTVIDGLDVRGDIDVQADNVTIRNTRVIADGEWAIIQRERADGLVIEDSEIRGDGKNRLGKGIFNLGGMLTVRRTDISVVTDGIMTDQGLIEDNFLHDPKYYPDDHVDMIQSGGGPAPGLTLVVRHNTVINTVDQTSAVALFQDFGVAHDILIERNLLAGGGYTLYAGEGSIGRSYNIRIIDNVWSRHLFPKGGYYGPVAYWDSGGDGNVWRGNVWAETGEPISP